MLPVATALLAGCGGEPRDLEGRDLEAMLGMAMEARLDGLAVDNVECVFLTRELTRCFAEGAAGERDFRLPVSVTRARGELTWSVAEADLSRARRGTAPQPLRPGELVAVEGSRGRRVQIRLREPIDPLEVTYPDASPKYAHRYVALPVELRNAGGSAYADKPLARASATLSDGTLITRAPLVEGDCGGDGLERVRLGPGERARGCIVFEVPNARDLAGVSLQLGDSESVLQWQLGRGAAT